MERASRASPDPEIAQRWGSRGSGKVRAMNVPLVACERTANERKSHLLAQILASHPMFAASKSSVRITKRPTKHVVKTVVQEHYLRDDIGCGSAFCGICLQDNAPLSDKEGTTYLILDTNVILHQMDMLLKPILKNVVILSTVRSEVQNRSYQSYLKLTKILNDEERHFYVFVNEHARCAPPSSPEILLAASAASINFPLEPLPAHSVYVILMIPLPLPRCTEKYPWR